MTHAFKKHLLGTNEASGGAASGRVVLPAPARRLSLLGCLGWAGAAPVPHAGSDGAPVPHASSDWDTAIERLSEVVNGIVGARIV